MNEFSIPEAYLPGNVHKHQYHRLSPIPEETEEELLQWNMTENLTEEEMQKDKSTNEYKISRRKKYSLSTEYSINSPIKDVPDIVKMLQEMTLFAKIKG
ncbi:hypothetical protein NPIL_223381 [Nephila pilipes]|uniref:Uncharacterized protein n=1 Tax=Nephila pilipes TaxID=299642 RepID=A0A8X6MH51_NEPPI|nr:hypothetical protein NPIL_223381 [Nephila pilipes]